MLVLPEQPLIGVACHIRRNVVQRHEHLPAWRCALLSDLSANERFQLLGAIAAPPVIGQRHQQVFQRRVVAPLPMRLRKPRQPFGDTVRAKQQDARRLVFTPRASQLVGKVDLPDVMDRQAEADGFTIIRQVRPRYIEARDNSAGRSVDERGRA